MWRQCAPSIGDKVAWTGWVSFGKIQKRFTGVVIGTGFGEPYYHDPPQYVYPGYIREAGRHPAVMVRTDLPQHGLTKREYAPDQVIAINKLELIETDGSGTSAVEPEVGPVGPLKID